MLTAVVFGLAPALQASRPDLNETLKDGGRGSTHGRSRMRHALIVSQVALALVLLAGAGLLVNSFVRLLDVPPGFEPRGALALSVSLPDAKYPDAERRAAVTDELLARIRALPGVESAGVTQVLPLNFPPDTLIKIPGRQGPQDGAFSCDFDYVVADTFRALGTPLVRGRFVDERDAAAKAQVALVNEAFVRTHFPVEDPIGKGIDEGGKRWEIVGVVGDVRYRGLANRIRPMLYRSLVFSKFATRRLVVRTKGAAPGALVEPIRKAVLAVDPDQPIAGAQSLEEVVAASLAQRRLALSVLALFAGAAVLLAALGLYGVVSYTVLQRTREIGIRMAVGASRRAVQGLFVRQGLRLAGLGIVVGLAGSLGLTHLLATQLYGVEPTDPATFAAVAALLALVAALASLLPARRAAKVEPMRALR
jgi:predicted permease